MSGRIDRIARGWWIPTLISIGLTWYIRTQVLVDEPLTRYQFAGAFKPFDSFRALDATLIAFREATEWTFLLIVTSAVAIGLACVFFRNTYQSPWMRNFGYTLALGTVAGTIAALVANTITLSIINTELSASARAQSQQVAIDSIAGVDPLWEHVLASLSWFVLFILVVTIAYAAFGLGVYSLRLLSLLLDRGDWSSIISQRLPVPEFGPDPAISYDARAPDNTTDRQSETNTLVGICSSGGGMRSAIFNLGAYQALTEEDVLQDASVISAVSGGAYMAGGRSAVDLYLGASSTEPAAYAHRSPEERHLRSNSSYLAPSFLGRVGMVSRLVLGLLVNIIFVGAVIGIIAIPWGWFISSKYLHEETSGRFDTYVHSTSEIGAAAQDVANAIQDDIGRTPTRFLTAGTELQLALRDARILYNIEPGLDLLVEDYAIEEPEELETSWRSMELLLYDTAALLAEINAALTTEANSNVPFPAEQVIQQAERVVDDADDIKSAIQTREQPDIPVDGALGAIIIALGLGLLLGVLSVSVRRINNKNLNRITFQRTGALLIAISIAQVLTFLVWPWLLTQTTSDLLTRSGELVAIFQGIGAAILGIGAVKTLVSRQAGALAKIAGGIVAPAMAIVAFFVLLRIGATSAQEHYWIIGCVVIYLLIMAFFDLNVWSLHPWYRRRLRTAFGVKRNGDTVAPLTDKELTLSRYTEPRYPDPGVHPPPLICAAANVNEPGRTPTALNAVSFPFSAYRIGTPGLVAQVTDEDQTSRTRTVNGWIGTKEAEEIIVTQRNEMSLLGAMAISGAAVSPGMGKMTLRSVQALMALANLRLGVWFPNPMWLNELNSRERRKKWRERVRASYLFKEVFGIYRQTDKFLYISDGGHWENLGLVELLRKRCSLIYCFDASGDKTDRFKTLGEAIAIARTDLGIEFNDVNPYDQQSNPTDSTKDDEHPVMRAKENVSVFHFTYPNKTRGRIIYCKPVVTEGASVDVKEYQETNRQFPAHSTLDQFFDHEQFEAYRMIGYAAGESAAKRGRPQGETNRGGTAWTRGR